MKLNYVMTCMLLFCGIAFAQSQPQGIIYLKDGSIMRGTILTGDSSGAVRILTQGNVFTYPRNQVDRMERGDTAKAIHYHNYDLKVKGYICDIQFGSTDVLAKDAGIGITMFSFNLVNSYQFSPYASLGIGVGTEIAASNVNLQTFSLYADTKIYLMKSNISPFINVDAGYNGMFIKYYYTYYYNSYYGTTFQNKNAKDGDHGVMANPALGIRVALGKKVAMTAAIGYKFYYLHTSRQYYILSGDGTFRTDGASYYLFNSLSFKAGFQF